MFVGAVPHQAVDQTTRSLLFSEWGDVFVGRSSSFRFDRAVKDVHPTSAYIQTTCRCRLVRLAPSSRSGSRGRSRSKTSLEQANPSRLLVEPPIKPLPPFDETYRDNAGVSAGPRSEPRSDGTLLSSDQRVKTAGADQSSPSDLDEPETPRFVQPPQRGDGQIDRIGCIS